MATSKSCVLCRKISFLVINSLKSNERRLLTFNKIDHPFSRYRFGNVANNFHKYLLQRSKRNAQHVFNAPHHPVFSVLKRHSSFINENTEQDLLDIKEILKLQLDHKEKNEDTHVTEKALDILDTLIQARVNEISFEELTRTVSEESPTEIYAIASKIFSLSSKVGEEASVLSAPLFKIAALNGSKDAKYSYGQLLCRGSGGIAADPIQAVQLFTELAKEGHPYAQFSLAGMYYTGYGIEQSYETSYTLYQVAAENGIIQSYNSLGKMYLNGEGVETDEEKAVEYFKKGADKGEPRACMSLAHCYSHGKGVDADFDKAFLYHQKAANTGYAAGLYNVGTHYFAGKGVGMDLAKAVEYFQLSAQSGFTLAEVNLGNMYYQGLGVEKDINKAKEFYKKAAPKNHSARMMLEEIELEEKKNESKNGET